MNALTKFSLQWGTNSAVAFLTFIGVVNPATSIGVGIIITGYTLYLIADTFKIYSEDFTVSHSRDKSLLNALSANSVDIVFFFIFLATGFYLGLS